MIIKKMYGPLAVILFFGLVGPSCETNAWNVSSFWPKVRVIGARLVNSRYFAPIAVVACVVAAGYAGYKSGSDNQDAVRPVPVPPPLPPLRRLNGVEDSQPPRANQRQNQGFFDTLTNEGYLKREEIQLGGVHAPGRGIVVPNERGNGQVRVQQTLVHNQFGTDGGGWASCGYQALKNACGIASTVLGHDRRNWLTSPDVVQQLIGPVGRWRARVIEQRQKVVLRAGIIENFLLFNPGARNSAGHLNSEKIRGLYQTLRDNYASSVVDRLFTDEQSVDITVDGFVAWVQARDVAIGNPAEYGAGATAEGIVEHIRNRGTILAYLDVKSGRCTSAYRQQSVSSEWLRGGEIDHLIEQFKQEQEHLRNIPMIVLDSVNADHLRELDHGEAMLEEVRNLRNAIRDGTPLPHQVYAFVLGDMQYSGMSGSAGHWMTLVLDAREQNQRRYTLADSAHNTLRLYAGPCHQFIQYLEGDLVAGRLRLPDEHREPGFTGWLAHKWRQF